MKINAKLKLECIVRVLVLGPDYRRKKIVI